MTMSPVPEYRFAGFWWRVLAILIDVLIFSIVQFGISSLGLASLNLASSGESEMGVPIGFCILGILISWLYPALFESSSWRATPGKRVCGLIVTDLNGQRISFGRATGRYFAKILSALILYVGFMMAGWTSRKQALHDVICNTLVLKKTAPSLRMSVPEAA